MLCNQGSSSTYAHGMQGMHRERRQYSLLNSDPGDTYERGQNSPSHQKPSH